MDVEQLDHRVRDIAKCLGVPELVRSITDKVNGSDSDLVHTPPDPNNHGMVRVVCALEFKEVDDRGSHIAAEVKLALGEPQFLVQDGTDSAFTIPPNVGTNTDLVTAIVYKGASEVHPVRHREDPETGKLQTSIPHGLHLESGGHRIQFPTLDLYEQRWTTQDFQCYPQRTPNAYINELISSRGEIGTMRGATWQILLAKDRAKCPSIEGWYIPSQYDGPVKKRNETGEDEEMKEE